jgi:Spy/CpxP family protein refolding chaperone
LSFQSQVSAIRHQVVNFHHSNFRRFFWLIPALLISVGINLVAAGIEVGKRLGNRPDQRERLDWLMKDVDKRTTERLRGIIQHQLNSNRSELRAMRFAQRERHETIVKDPFDEFKTRNAMLKVRTATADLQEKMHDHMAKNLGRLSPAERIKLIKTLSRPERGRPRSLDDERERHVLSISEERAD